MWLGLYFGLVVDSGNQIRLSIAAKPACLPTGRLVLKVIQRSNTRNYWSKGDRDLGISSVGKVLLAIDVVTVHLGVKCRTNGPGSAAELNERSSWVDLNIGETMGGEPTGNRGDVAIRWPESSTEGLRRQPLVVSEGACVLLLIEELLQRLLLLGAALQHELHTVERRFVSNATPVELSPRQWMRIARQSGAPRVIHRLDDTGLRCR